jgi:hypothetical protein
LHRVIVLVELFVFQENRFDIENVYNDDFHRLESIESFVKLRFLDEEIRFLIEVSEREKSKIYITMGIESNLKV